MKPMTPEQEKYWTRGFITGIALTCMFTIVLIVLLGVT
jgi:hypothetical protein